MITLADTAGLRQRLHDHGDYFAPGEEFVLEVWRAVKAFDGPLCFKRDGDWGHLFGRDPKALEALARELGVKQVVIHREGRRGQHVDLCGKPLEKAIKEAKR